MHSNSQQSQDQSKIMKNIKVNKKEVTTDNEYTEQIGTRLKKPGVGSANVSPL
jgi:hypothetical protein